MSEKILNEIQAKFSIDLFKLLAAEDASRNVFYSPFSISIALAMIYAGSDGETKNQIELILFEGKNTGPVISNG